MNRTCSDCGASITHQSRSGRCKPCASRVSLNDPATKQRRLAALRAAKASPEHRAAMRDLTKQVNRDRADDPAWRAYKTEAGRRLRASYDASVAAQAANRSKRALVGRKLRGQRLGWLPDELRAEYLRLRNRKGAAEAKRLILAGMTPFERQLARVRDGARLVTVVPLRRAEHAHTLGGVASGML